MTTLDDLIAVDVCVDCYYAHHYGASYITRPATDHEEWCYHAGRKDDREFMGITWIETDTGLEVGEWFADESDQRCEGGQPLGLIDDGFEVTDWTYDPSDPDRQDEIERYGGGHTEFTWSSCQGCGSRLGGSRERLALWPRKDQA